VLGPELGRSLIWRRSLGWNLRPRHHTRGRMRQDPRYLLTFLLEMQLPVPGCQSGNHSPSALARSVVAGNTSPVSRLATGNMVLLDASGKLLSIRAQPVEAG